MGVMRMKMVIKWITVMVMMMELVMMMAWFVSFPFPGVHPYP